MFFFNSLVSPLLIQINYCRGGTPAWVLWASFPPPHHPTSCVLNKKIHWLWTGGTLEQVLRLSLQCLGRDVDVLIDTGCRFNLMSSSTVDRLGSVDHVIVQPVDALAWTRAWSLLSVLKSAGAGGGAQGGGGRSPVPEEAFCGRTHPRTGPDCRPAQNPLLLPHPRWGTKGQRSRWAWRATGSNNVSFSCLSSESNRPLISLGNKSLKSLKVSGGTSPKSGDSALI